MVEIHHKDFGSSKRVEKLPEAPKMATTDLRSLIELGCIKDNLKVGDITFSFKTLSATDKLSASKLFSEDLSAEALFAFNMTVLAMSIEAVDGKLLEEYHPNFAVGADVVELKRDLLSAMQPAVLGQLIDFYSKITQRGDAQFTEQQIKNS